MCVIWHTLREGCGCLHPGFILRRIFMSTAICHDNMLLFLPGLCSVLQFVREIKPSLDCVSTLPLTYRLMQVVFFFSFQSDFGVFSFSFLVSITFNFTAHWGNPDTLVKPIGQPWTGGVGGVPLCVSVLVNVCNHRWKRRATSCICANI